MLCFGSNLISIGGTNSAGSEPSSGLALEDVKVAEEEMEEMEEVEEGSELGFSVMRHSQALLSAAGMCHRLDSVPSSSTPL